MKHITAASFRVIPRSGYIFGPGRGKVGAMLTARQGKVNRVPRPCREGMQFRTVRGPGRGNE
ncbi:hypothetical protein GCM10011534_31720 [Pseudooceanicola nanhaiensis]|uniref:Uncharacterized protein n=1 Tax=Pseudooceanicola nanhaiensis TaxID=375761 RepID=A0A917T1X9_9RHOB|nr:hypothetical protein GCM10011534_31720 [Pseudooceanicola nanhaiensis]